MSSKKKKIIASATAGILLLAFGLAGTFAASGSDSSGGNIEDTVETKLFLHDDFSDAWTGSTRDRDIYAENIGDASLYVRIRLDEYMNYGGKSIISGTKQDIINSWKPHTATGSDVSDCSTGIHDFFTLQMGNDVGVKYKPQTKNSYSPALGEADKTETSSAAKVVTIKEYLNATDKPDPCWILDNDGYAYWYTQLKKTEATGLILNSITNTGLIDESYYYGIHARVEAVTEGDLNAWFNGTVPTDGQREVRQASKEAVRLLKNMSQKYTEITKEMETLNHVNAKDFDGDSDGYLTKKEYHDYQTALSNSVLGKVKACDVGGVITLDNATDTYGTTTDWLLLEKSNEEATLIAKDSITRKQYHSKALYPTWPESDLRNWLNSEGSFKDNGYLEDLDPEFVRVIKTETLKTAHAYDDWNTLDTSNDKVYLLTETGNNSKAVGKNVGDPALLTADQMKCDGAGGKYWWLRSPSDLHQGYESQSVGFVNCNTGAVGFGLTYFTWGIRPVVTINLQ